MEMSDVSLTAGPALSQPSDTRIGSRGAENREQERAQGSGCSGQNKKCLCLDGGGVKQRLSPGLDTGCPG